ncbi:hypothetical protein C8R45DRAFT_935403 [Mycena sanguinolenta]|nr:hypothetical protein C8R45DRAFT_935403 [Mycena sanguinolenta]
MHGPSRIATLLLSFVCTVSAATRDLAEVTVFPVYPDWDMSNGAADTIAVVTESTCLSLCASSKSDSTCAAYAYVLFVNGGDPLCILKNTIDLRTFGIQQFDVDDLIGLTTSSQRLPLSTAPASDSST